MTTFRSDSVMDASRIEPGQRFVRRPEFGPTLIVTVIGTAAGGGPDFEWDGEGTVDWAHPDNFYPIIEPERLHEIPVGATALNVATGAEFEWTDSVRMDWLNAQSSMTDAAPLTPLLALIATPEEDA